MKSVYVIFCLVIISLITSTCVLKEVVMNEESIYLLYKDEGNCENIKLSLYHGKVESHGNCLFKITFYNAHGGETVWFGKVVKDQKPQTQNKVKLYRNDFLIQEISYADILKMPSEQRDSINLYRYE